MSVSIGLPHLFGNELSLMEDVFRRRFRRYLEFGLGGSTLMAVRSGFEAIVAVDSDPDWVSAVKMHPEFSDAIATGRASILCGDIGPTRDWGNPKDESRVRSWPNYIAAAWAEWAKRSCLPDLIYIDGRFRVACAYSVAVVLAGKAVDPLILMHDFSEERPSYRDVLKFFEIEAQENSLVALKLRVDVSGVKALSELLIRQFDFG